ncbi:hypothetical protein B0H13DRAFT_2032763 [Mycena leptocephala]|nr:hypothetical protein B0H13DRAFT_2032763 [Mycena leptocephala]
MINAGLTAENRPAKIRAVSRSVLYFSLNSLSCSSASFMYEFQNTVFLSVTGACVLSASTALCSLSARSS